LRFDIALFALKAPAHVLAFFLLILTEVFIHPYPHHCLVLRGASQMPMHVSPRNQIDCGEHC